LIETNIDFFCGCGGLGLGLKKAGIRSVAAYDWEKFAVQSYNHNVEPVAQVADVTEQRGEDILDADMWSFGFPCVDVSKARIGERKMLEGKGSGTFFQVMRMLKERREAGRSLPKVLLAENVDGVQEAEPVIRYWFNEFGYNLHIRQYNSKDFGLAQNRLRFLMVGVPFGVEFEFLNEPDIESKVLEDVVETNVDEKYLYDKDRYPYTLHNTDHTRSPNTLIQVGEFHTNWLQIMKRIYSIKGISPTLHTSAGGHRELKLFDGKHVRRATPREYARLQGFDDSFEIVVSDTQARKQFGNAVSVPVGEHLGKAIRNIRIEEESI